GIDPDPALAGRVDLRPAMSWKARISFVKEVPAGDRISYGLRYELDDHSVVATVPAGYADGVTRRLSFAGGEVLIGGRRLPLAGTVTMDQIMVDCGPDADVAAGEVRGGAPATREFDLLSPERRVVRIDAVLLSGGSAFGLSAADGVMRFCEERGMGHPTAAGPVPIVVAASLFDLMMGDGSV